MSKNKSKGKKQRKIIAEKRIIILFNLAEKNAHDNRFDLADRYVKLARKLSMRYLIKIPSEYKRSYCKHCCSYLLPSVNSRFRIRNKTLVIFCEKCGKFTRIPLKSIQNSLSVILK